MKNTKARHQEILTAAVQTLETFGGVEAIDALSQKERIPILRKMGKMVRELTGCTIPPARGNIAKAMRKARFGIMQERDPDRWGGARPNTGRPPLPESQKRQAVSTRLAPGTKELAQAIAEVLVLPGWGHALEQGLNRMVEGDQELKNKLVEMGVISQGESFVDKGNLY